MPREIPANQVMTTSVLTFAPDEPVIDAMGRLVEAEVDGGPVLDQDGRVVGMLSTGDLIVQESRLHFPTVISLLGGVIELPSSQRHFEEDLRKAASATVQRCDGVGGPSPSGPTTRWRRSPPACTTTTCRVSRWSTTTVACSASSPAVTSCGRSWPTSTT